MQFNGHASRCFVGLALLCAVFSNACREDKNVDENGANNGGEGGLDASGGTTTTPSSTAGGRGEASAPSGGSGAVDPGTGGRGGNNGTAGAGGSKVNAGGTAGGPGTGGIAGQPATPATDPKLLTHDDFSTPASEANPPNLASGSGWTTEHIAVEPGWAFHTESSVWRVVSEDPKLQYLNLRTTGNYLRHENDGAGRCVDVNAYGSLAVKEGGQPSYVGADGTTLWLSVLVRVNDVSDTPVFFAMSDSPIPWNTKDTIWAAGVGKRHTGNNNWSLFTRTVAMPYEPDVPRDPTTTVTKSAKTMTPKVTSLLVLRFDFKPGNDVVSLYVDPPTLGLDPPAAPDAVATTKMDLKLRCFQAGMYQGATTPTPDHVSFDLDEIRFGTTFSAVTPTK